VGGGVPALTGDPPTPAMLPGYSTAFPRLAHVWTGRVWSRRSPHTARPRNELLGSLVVTHPFHPLHGERLEVLFERRRGDGRVYVCAGGPLGSVTLAEHATDRGGPPAERPLTYELLVELGAVAAALRGSWRPAGNL